MWVSSELEVRVGVLAPCLGSSWVAALCLTARTLSGPDPIP